MALSIARPSFESYHVVSSSMAAVASSMTSPQAHLESLMGQLSVSLSSQSQSAPTNSKAVEIHFDHASSLQQQQQPRQSQQQEFCTRFLQISDFQKGYMQILAQLTNVGDVSEEQFQQRFLELQKYQETHCNIVIEDIARGKIIGAATLLIEKKFIRSCSAAAHVEDVVVDASYRGKNLGLRIIEECKRLAKERGCYKIILDCTEKNAPFYEKCGFVKKELQMRCDL